MTNMVISSSFKRECPLHAVLMRKLARDVVMFIVGSLTEKPFQKIPEDGSNLQFSIHWYCVLFLYTPVHNDRLWVCVTVTASGLPTHVLQLWIHFYQVFTFL